MARKVKTVRVGIVGMGIRGQMYAATCRQLSNAELVGVCDVADAARAAATEQFEVSGFAEVEAMCEKARPDAVVICTPDFAHAAPALAAAQAGCHLLLEKPLAMSVAEARQIADCVADAKVRAMMAFENHWNPPLSAMKAAVAAGELGRLISCNSQLDDRIDVPTKLLSWLGRSSPGWFLMAHSVELAGWIAQQKPVSVFAAGTRGVLNGRGLETYDGIHAVVRFDGGMVGSFSSCWVLPQSLPLIFQFRHEMVGTEGSARADLTDQMLHKATAARGDLGGKYEHPSTIGVTMTGSLTSPPAQMFAQFVAGLISGEPLGCPLEDGLVNVAAIAAIHESIETTKAVEVRV